MDRHSTIDMMVKAHDKLCDNPDYSFGINTNMVQGKPVYAAYFRTPQSTNLFIADTFSEVVQQVCSDVMQADIPQVQGQCTFGQNGQENLAQEIINTCRTTLCTTTA